MKNFPDKDRERHVRDERARIQHNVPARGDPPLVEPNHFAKPPPDTISDHGLSQTLRGGDPHPCARHTVREVKNRACVRASAPSLLIDPSELRPAQEAHCLGIGLR